MVELSAEGDIRYAGTFSKSYAGDTFNTAVAAARLGSSVGYLTAVGQDPFALGLMHKFAQEGLDTTHVRHVPGGFTGLYFAAVRDDGSKDFLYYRKGSAASHLDEADVTADMIAGTRAVFSSGITLCLSESARRTVFKAFRLAREQGVMTVFDPNFRNRLWKSESDALDAMNALLPLVDVILPSVPEDTLPVIGLARPDQVIDFYAFKDIKLVVVKAGADGCYLHYKKKTEHIPAMRVAAVDTTGAGDAFNGGFLHGLATGQSLRDCARLGVTVAGLKVQNRGTLQALPNRESVYSRAFAGAL